jgi:hypothetical protein
VLETNSAGGAYWILVQGLATCVDLRVYQLGVLQYDGTTSQQRALPPDPGYDGFPKPQNFRVSYNNAHAQTLSMMQPLPH